MKSFLLLLILLSSVVYAAPRKFAILVDHIIQQQVIWDGVTTWDPTIAQNDIDAVAADISTAGYRKMGAPFHDRQGNSYNYNIVADGNSHVVADFYDSSVKQPVRDGVLDAVVTPDATQYDFINMGHNGWSTTDLSARAANDIDLLYESALTTNNIVIFWEGTNDISILGKTDVQAYANIKSYCQARKAAGWRVIVATIMPRNGGGANHETYRTSVNTSIRTNAISEGWADAVADVGGDASLQNPSNTTYFRDGLHLTQAGQLIALEYFKAAIESLL